MVFRRIVIAVAVFVLFAGGAYTVYQVADHSQDAAPAEPRNVTNESVIVEYDAWQFVDNATRQYTTGFNDSVSVYNQSGAQLVRGADYSWNATDGTVRFHPSTQTVEGNVSSISYTYYWNTQHVRELSRPLDVAIQAVGRGGLLAGGIAMVVLLLAFGGFVASKIGNSGIPKTNR